jgi:hypothetical protein
MRASRSACAGLLLRAITAAVLLGALASAPAGATITIVNLDDASEGFNDPTPAAPVGGNPGTTVGQQRLNLFQHAAAIWDAILVSSVEIRIEANFDPLFCTALSAVLGSAGPNVVDSDFTGATYATTWYTGAEANRLAGADLDPGMNDIACQFNSSLGSVGCLTGRNWYYGYDNDEGASGIDLLPVLLHEFGHGLGFLTTTDDATGAYLAGLPSIFDRYLMDDVTGKHWFEMTPAERVTSAIHSGHLVWDGPRVTATTGVNLGPRARVIAAGALSATYLGSQASFGAPLTAGGLTAQVVVVNDGVGTASDACETPFANAAAVSGKIALIDRGTCTIAQKAANAQANGAVGILFVNNNASTPGTWSGVAPAVTIPMVGVSLADGNAIRTAAGSGVVTLTLGLDPAHLAGANDAGRARMFDPNPDQPGSSVSHYDVTAYPNQLMEPSINTDLTDDLGLTYELFVDIGWFPQVTAVEPAEGDLSFSLGPNPSREGGTLRFGLGTGSDVDVTIFDVAGRRIARLARGPMPAGPHALSWSRRDEAGQRAPAGIYLVRLRAGGIERSATFVLMD